MTGLCVYSILNIVTLQSHIICCKQNTEISIINVCAHILLGSRNYKLLYIYETIDTR